MVVHADDLIAGKIVCQLKLATGDAVRATLRALAKTPDGQGVNLLNLLFSRGALDRDGRARVARYARLYKGARTAALETALLKQLRFVPDSHVDRALADVEARLFDKRVVDMLVQQGEIGRAQAERIVEQIARTLASEDARLVSGYAEADYEGVARSLTKDRSAPLDTGQFTVKKLFRSKESQRLARMSAMSAERDAKPPVAPASTTRFETTRAAPAPRRRTPPQPMPPPGTQPQQLPPASRIEFDAEEQTFALRSPLQQPAKPPEASPPPAPEAPPPPEAAPASSSGLAFNRIGPYLLLRKLGEGTLGPVYLARRADLAKPVAVKIAPHALRAHALGRFKRALALGRDLRHESLVQVLDVSEHDGVGLMALELVTGEPLGAVLAREGPHTEPRALALLADALGALQVVHAAGLVHGDLSPESILVASGQRPKAKLPDLGSAVRASQRLEVPASGPRVTFAAPETLLEEPVDARADLYSIGLVVFAALTGRLPYAQATPEQLRDQKLALAPLTLGQARPDRPFSPALEELLARLLARDRTLRPPSAARALKAVGEIVLPGIDARPDTARLGARFDALFRTE